ncbi:MAG TPA: type III pantothenate kinase [Methylophilaceae bacterium]|nr:type III pantothenate kinase [Methylophilaceae bacterium]
MLMVIDAGNTRTKWAVVRPDGTLSSVQSTLNTKLLTSVLKQDLTLVDKAVVANVAGEIIAAQLKSIMPKSLEPSFMMPASEACNVINRYEQVEKLGIDRWAAVIAAWHMNKQPSLVINAGTAITIDALGKDKTEKKGEYLGGSIMPGLQLLFDALSENTANLNIGEAGRVDLFPKKTVNAIQTGCMNAIVGAVVLQTKQLEKHCAFLPKVVISGGDAVKIAEALSHHIKRVIVAENLVLQGLALIGKKFV